MSTEYILKWRIRNYRYPVTIVNMGGYLRISFRYQPDLVEEVKMMAGARWNPHDRYWTVENCPRNLFTIAFLSEQNPYAPYDGPLIEFKPRRYWCYEHQIDMTRHMITRMQCIIACEMGTGKTLSAIEALEYFNDLRTYWVGPRSALYSVQLEFERWLICDICNLPKFQITLPNGTVILAHDSKDHVWLTGKAIRPKFFTYEALRKLVDEWPEDKEPPKIIIFDESSRLKNPTAQRTQAALALTADMRKKWGTREVAVILMSGSPAPKSPLDWYAQTEVACPGFLREGNIQKFQKRLAVIEQRESITGGVYPHLVCWRDSVNRCEQCGLMKDNVKHDLAAGGHTFKPCTDEISALYGRMKGLVQVKFKKDVLDLPEKQYRLIELKPSADLLRAAQLIDSKAGTAIQALTLLRELSDGFQYKEIETGSQKCPMCGGKRSREFPVDLAHPELPLDALTVQTGYRVIYDEAGVPTVTDEKVNIGMKEQACDACYGTGEIPKYSRTIMEVKSPKEDAFKDLLDLHEEVGRFVGYGGFTGSVDKLVKICKNMGWEHIRVDGRGWESSLRTTNPVKMLEMFQSDKGLDRCAFIGQPGAAGMGLTLTASPSIGYYSNDFNAESRIQSEDRIHRPGMDVNRGATIYDFILLPSDLLVLNNLKRKKRLQDLTLGQMREEIEALRFSQIRSW